MFSSCLLFTGGCIIPWPHWKETAGPLCGRVVAKEPNQPVQNAAVEVYYTDGGQRETLTNEYGFFYFPEKTRFCWGILFGGALNHSLPLKDCVGGFTLHIRAEGYDELIESLADWRELMTQTGNPGDQDLQDAGCAVIPLARKDDDYDD